MASCHLLDSDIRLRFIEIKCIKYRIYQKRYIFGGWDGFKTLDELYTYSFASNYWYLERVRSRPPSRYRHSSTLIGCSIFIFGGVDAKMTRYNDLYEFNCETREWKSIETAGITPSARTFH